MSSQKLTKVLWAGRLSYQAGLNLQQSLAQSHFDNYPNGTNSLILLEHNPVYTVGIRDKEYTKEEEAKLRGLGADFHRTNRGGLITFHGPGQLVAYPIINLRNFRTSMKWYIEQIEKMVIRLCAEYGLKGECSPHTGVWVNDRKICAIGVHGSRYITTHGLAMNCNVDLKWFSHIVPCGIKGKGVTSVSEELGATVTVDQVVPKIKQAFSDQFECDVVDYSLEEAYRTLNLINKQKIKS